MKAPRNNRGFIDWKTLKKRWMLSDMHPSDFLDQFDEVSKKQSRYRSEVSSWKKMMIKRLESNPGPELPIKDNALPVDELPTDKELDKAMMAWKEFQEWKRSQGPEDWKMADALRVHVKMLLNSSIVKMEDGKIKSGLSATSMSSIANTLSQLQKIQRLALGMSTDIHGVIEPMDPQVETPENTKEEHLFPTFIVETTENGKFKRSRPRQIA